MKSKCPLCVNVSFVTLCNVSSPNPSSCVKQMWLYVFYLCTAICQQRHSALPEAKELLQKFPKSNFLPPDHLHLGLLHLSHVECLVCAGCCQKTLGWGYYSRGKSRRRIFHVKKSFCLSPQHLSSKYRCIKGKMQHTKKNTHGVLQKSFPMTVGRHFL